MSHDGRLFLITSCLFFAIYILRVSFVEDGSNADDLTSILLPLFFVRANTVVTNGVLSGTFQKQGFLGFSFSFSIGPIHPKARLE
jgi:hypothetical protein